MTPEELHKFFESEGCVNYWIEGVSHGIHSDVDCLGFKNGKWVVYYTERGMDNEPFFSSEKQDEAIEFYKKHVLSIEHWHIVAFTRRKEVAEKYWRMLKTAGIRIIQNDIPNYSSANDHVYRLFVVNKDIFKARALSPEIPFRDPELIRK